MKSNRIISEKWLPFFLCSFLYIFFTIPVCSQSIIEGIVMDNNQNLPIEGANITLKGMDKGIYSDEKGNFSLNIRQKITHQNFCYPSGI